MPQSCWQRSWWNNIEEPGCSITQVPPKATVARQSKQHLQQGIVVPHPKLQDSARFDLNCMCRVGYNCLQTIKLAAKTHSMSSHPCGFSKHLPVDPREQTTHVEHTMPIQWTNPSVAPLRTANNVALSC